MKSKKGLKPLISTLFIFACLALIGYGVYMYVQDSQTTPEESAASEEGETPSGNSEAETGSATGSEADPAAEQFQELDTTLAEQTKKDLETTPAPTENNAHLPEISIAFSIYSEEALSLGASFAKTSEIADSCLLTIQAGNQSLEKSIAAISQPQMQGCRFNSLDLSQLTAGPSTATPWRLTIAAYDDQDVRITKTLSKNITSLSSLNNLNN